MTPNPKRLYETERKRQQRARLAEGQVHKVVVYLRDDQKAMLDKMASMYISGTENDAITDAIVDSYYSRYS